MEFLVKFHNDVFNASEFVDIFTLAKKVIAPQSETMAIFTVNFDFGHKKVPFVATEPLV
jgi:hypothetical protein